MTRYVLSEPAEEDLIEIYIAGATNFGLDQAKRYHKKLHQAFEFLAENPLAAPVRPELRPACRIHPVGSHIVIYTIRKKRHFSPARQARARGLGQPIRAQCRPDVPDLLAKHL